MTVLLERQDTPEFLPGEIVHNSKVPCRSPFKYPGGKVWMIPRLRRWIGSLGQKPGLIIEPFCGGATASLTTVFEDLVGAALMVERDERVAAVWRTILSDEAGWLEQCLLGYEVERAGVIEKLAEVNLTGKDLAFATVLRNRIAFGGIMTPGATNVAHWGGKGRGLGKYWNPAMLAGRVRAINAVSPRIVFEEGDGLAVMRREKNRASTVWFIDPPYTSVPGSTPGRPMYAYNAINHEELFALMSQLRGDFVATYDDSPKVRSLVKQYGFDNGLASVRCNQRNANKAELLIGRDLSWARAEPAKRQLDLF